MKKAIKNCRCTKTNTISRILEKLIKKNTKPIDPFDHPFLIL